jgi:hypothetical protein
VGALLLWLEKNGSLDFHFSFNREATSKEAKEAKEADCMIEQEQVEIKTILFIILNFFTQAIQPRSSPRPCVAFWWLSTWS